MTKTPILAVTLLSISLFASDPVTIDSLFRNQQGIRSISTISFVSSVNANTYALYPELMTQNDGRVWTDTKSVVLSQTLIYTASKNLDILATGTGSSKRREYIDFSGYKHSDATDFDSLWLGGIYSLESIGDFKPQLSGQLSATRE